jgi:hypothetical protein
MGWSVRIWYMSGHTTKQRAVSRTLCVIGYLLVATGLPAQTQPDRNSEPHEIQLTGQGLLVLDTPKGWQRTEGPGIATFVKKGARLEKADVWIYVSGTPIGPSEEVKSRDEYIESDAVDFRARFKNGTVKIEEPLPLPNAKTSAPVRTFESAESHNSFEQVVYIAEQTRILTFVLSAKTRKAYAASLPVFHEFAQSYNGSIVTSPDPTHP